MRFALVILTYQAGRLWEQWLQSLDEQSLKPSKIIMIDSSSTDDTVPRAISYGLQPIIISPLTFNHGGTRNLAVELVGDVDVIVFMTQDAIFDSTFSLSNIVRQFQNHSITAACGRQLPHLDANPLATHARLFNYPDESRIKSAADIPELGLNVAFMSNSFAAYRLDVFEQLGGFPENTILAEDMYLAAKIIQAGYKVAYCADAAVLHSHNYTPWDEFRRYFDIGVFHACEPWIQQQFGGAAGLTHQCS